MDTHCGMKHTLCGFSLGFAFGVVEALYMLLFAWGARLYGYDTSFIQQIGQVFYGYAPTMVGGLYGGVWGFVDGFVFGFLVAWIYNYSLCFRCKKSSASSENKDVSK